MKAIDFTSYWYKNCKRRRREKARICEECPFKRVIEKQEKQYESNR